jgi:hypothetical protein
VIRADRFYNVLHSQTTPFDFHVKPASTNQTTSTLVELANVAFATVNVEETHTIYARDVFGNAQDDHNDAFTVQLTHNDDSAEVVDGVVTEQAEPSVFEVKYTLTRAGQYTMVV